MNRNAEKIIAAKRSYMRTRAVPMPDTKPIDTTAMVEHFLNCGHTITRANNKGIMPAKSYGHTLKGKGTGRVQLWTGGRCEHQKQPSRAQKACVVWDLNPRLIKSPR